MSVPSSLSRPLAASLDRFLVLAGPTAVGKSEIALHLAELLQGEIISVDSMQVYRGMDIGTAKPGATERQRIPHHLLDAVGISEPFHAAAFLRLAAAAASGILARGHLPIFAGGTGLYLRAVLEGLSEIPTSDPVLRAELEAAPLEQLLRELADRDPEGFQRIDRRNPRRVIRAVEIIRLTGSAASSKRNNWRTASASSTSFMARSFALSRDADSLRYGSINASTTCSHAAWWLKPNIS